MRKLLISLAFVLIFFIIFLPFAGIAVSAFQEGIGAFGKAIFRPQALHAFYLSLLITLIVTLINSVIGVGLSLELVRGTWLAGNKRIARLLKLLVQTLIDLPFAVSPIIVGLMVILLFGPTTLMGTFFAAHGVKIVYALPGMVMATLFITFPLMIREVVPSLQEIGTTSEEASATLGAGSWHTFANVTWPAIRWGVIYGLVLTVSRSLGEFGSILVVSGNIINQTQTATTLVYQDTENNNLISANSIAFVLGMISITILLYLEWIKKRKAAQLHAH